MAKVIGITGSMGSGKSTVGQILEALGVPVIDTDAIVHKLLTEPTKVRNSVVNHFGHSIVGKNGAIDRAELGKMVFADSQARKDLEALVHPEVLAETSKQVELNKDKPVVAVLVPLLFEAHLENKFDEIWTVIANEQVLRKRIAERTGLSQAEISQRLGAQMRQAEKAAHSTHVIDNSGTMAETRKHVIDLISH